ncbi:hypothetical protein ACO0QE_000557 [Hanseniaspora vineae]
MQRSHNTQQPWCGSGDTQTSTTDGGSLQTGIAQNEQTHGINVNSTSFVNNNNNNNNTVIIPSPAHDPSAINSTRNESVPTTLSGLKHKPKSYRSTTAHPTPVHTINTKSIDISKNNSQMDTAVLEPAALDTAALEPVSKPASHLVKNDRSQVTTTTTTTTTAAAAASNSNVTNIMILKISKVLLKTDLPHKRRVFQHYSTFLHDVLKRSKTTKTCLILATYYYGLLIKQLDIAKQLTTSEMEMTEYCAKRKFYGCLILAHKYINDKTYNMESWSIISGKGGLSKMDISKIEKWCLEKLNYELYVKDLSVLQKWCLDKLLNV